MKRYLEIQTTGPDHFSQTQEAIEWLQSVLGPATYSFAIRTIQGKGVRIRVTWVPTGAEIGIAPPAWYSEIEASG